LKREDFEQSQSFFGKTIRESFKLHPQACKRYFKTLELHELIEEVNFSHKNGYEYKILNWQEYDLIKDHVSRLDKILLELRDKYPSA